LEAGANPVLVAFRLGYVSTRMVEQHYSGRLDRTRRSARRWVRGTLRHGLRHA
jgi:thiosulfate reductase cytochrome b subunit